MSLISLITVQTVTISQVYASKEWNLGSPNPSLSGISLVTVSTVPSSSFSSRHFQSLRLKEWNLDSLNPSFSVIDCSCTQ